MEGLSYEQTGWDFSKGRKGFLPLMHIFLVCIYDTHSKT